MAPNLDIRSPEKSDLPAVAALLAAEGFGDDALDRLVRAYSEIQGFTLIATLDGEVQGVLIASFNGWHIFLSHLAVAPDARRRGIGRSLVEALACTAVDAAAKGIIADARLSAVGFFHELEFRLSGAVFLVREPC